VAPATITLLALNESMLEVAGELKPTELRMPDALHLELSASAMTSSGCTATTCGSLGPREHSASRSQNPHDERQIRSRA
jgi:hypothetical protein